MSHIYTVYLIHLAKPIGNERHTAQHYIGFARNLKKRIDQHKNSTGARLLHACNERAIAYDVERTWEFPTAEQAYTWERHLKRMKGSAPYCPLCRTQRNAKRRSTRRSLARKEEQLK